MSGRFYGDSQNLRQAVMESEPGEALGGNESPKKPMIPRNTRYKIGSRCMITRTGVRSVRNTEKNEFGIGEE